MKALVLAALLAATTLAAPPPETIQVDAQSIVWNPGSAKLPKGTKVAVLEGNPTKAGMFTMRLEVPAGSKIAPHWHPRPERVTILSGQVEVGFGDTWDDTALRAFHAGDFYVNPPNSHHFVLFAKTSVVQITGDGPWEIQPVGSGQ
jgi:quercetin dioxygenase-like cupin family protein